MSWLSRLLDIALFVLGMYLAMRVIAAAYRLVDLWYTIRTAYPRVIRGIAGWSGVTLATALLVGRQHMHAFTYGFGAFLVIYFSLRAVTVLHGRMLAARG